MGYSSCGPLKYNNHKNKDNHHHLDRTRQKVKNRDSSKINPIIGIITITVTNKSYHH